MSVSLCVTVFNRHDLLRRLLMSLRESSVMPEVFILDHGYDTEKVKTAVTGTVETVFTIVTLEDPGIAHGANWFINNVSEERVMCADDVVLFPHTLERLVATPGDLVSPTWGGNFLAYPLFVLRDSCVEKVGLFDETISPGYLYFEDWDYTHRMALAGVQWATVEAEYRHEHNGSISQYTPEQMQEHHRRFAIAQRNYYKKWPELRVQ